MDLLDSVEWLSEGVVMVRSWLEDPIGSEDGVRRAVESGYRNV